MVYTGNQNNNNNNNNNNNKSNNSRQYNDTFNINIFTLNKITKDLVESF